MPRFALRDADGVAVNIVSLGRAEDITRVLEHVRDEASEIILREDGSAVLKQVETDEHLAAHGAVDLVEVNASVRVGMKWQGDHFAWPPKAPAAAQPSLPAPDTAQ